MSSSNSSDDCRNSDSSTVASVTAVAGRLPPKRAVRESRGLCAESDGGYYKMLLKRTVTERSVYRVVCPKKLEDEKYSRYERKTLRNMVAMMRRRLSSDRSAAVEDFMASPTLACYPSRLKRFTTLVAEARGNASQTAGRGPSLGEVLLLFGPPWRQPTTSAAEGESAGLRAPQAVCVWQL